MQKKYRNDIPIKKDYTRVNYQIKAYQVRVVKDNEQLGVMLVDNAIKSAKDADLDLVEIVPNAKPPVCQIMDYGKYKFEQKQKEKEVEKKKRESKLKDKIKTIRLSVKIEDNDLMVKTNQAKGFLTSGKKVKITLKFKGRRELAHVDQGYEIVNKCVSMLEGLSVIQFPPKLGGNMITAILIPKD